MNMPPQSRSGPLKQAIRVILQKVVDDEYRNAEGFTQWGLIEGDIDAAIVAARSENRTQEITAKFLEECGYVRKGGARLTFQGGDNIAPTAVEYYNPETGHAVLEFVSVQPVLLEKGKEAQYVKRYLYWAALTQEKK